MFSDETFSKLATLWTASSVGNQGSPGSLNYYPVMQRIILKSAVTANKDFNHYVLI